MTPVQSLEQRVDGLSISDEPEPEGDEVAALRGDMLPLSSSNGSSSGQLSTSPYATSPASISSPQGQGGRYMNSPTAPGPEALAYSPNSSGFAQPTYTTSYGSAQGTGYGRGQPGNGVTYNSVGTSQLNGFGRANGSSNTMPQYPAPLNNTRPMTNPDNSAFRGQNQNGAAANSQRKQGTNRKPSMGVHSLVDAKHTKTENLPKKPLWKGKLLTSYARPALLTPIRVQTSRKQGVQARICASPASMVCSDTNSDQVFKVVWTEPEGNGNGRGRAKQSNFSYVTDAKHGELAYTSIRRFVIYKTRQGHSLCLYVSHPQLSPSPSL